MKKGLLIAILSIHYLLFSVPASAQCSICTKTTQQLGEKPAKGMNSGIIYLALIPYAIVGFIGYKWWKSNRHSA
jgi:hypothetical protein